MGLDFSFFIGLLVVVLTFIPYLGIILCYIPAILIAIIQYGDFVHPLYVVAIMFSVQTLESTIISPKIVGDSVGLHPVTVIFSVFGWSLLLNGPIGAILAVPLSATVKVLLRRYVWEASGRGRHFVPLSGVDGRCWRTRTAAPTRPPPAKRDADGPGGPASRSRQRTNRRWPGRLHRPGGTGKKMGEKPDAAGGKAHRGIAADVLPGASCRTRNGATRLIARAAGAAVLGFVLYAVFALRRQANSSGWAEG